MKFKSSTIVIYDKAKNLDSMTPRQIAFVDSVYAMAEKNYQKGGDGIVECFAPKEIIASFKSIKEAKSYCCLRKEREDEVRSEIF